MPQVVLVVYTNHSVVKLRKLGGSISRFPTA